MKIPALPIRAALRLSNEAQRIMWATEQLMGGLTPSPTVAANVPAGIPEKKVANKGAVKEVVDILEKCYIQNVGDGYREIFLWMPFDPAQYYRGVPIEKCVLEMSLDAVLPTIQPIASGNPIPDTSTATTIEQYILEQAKILLPNAVGQNYLEIATEKWYSTDYLYRRIPVVKLRIVLDRDVDYEGNDYYGRFSPHVVV